MYGSTTSPSREASRGDRRYESLHSHEEENREVPVWQIWRRSTAGALLAGGSLLLVLVGFAAVLDGTASSPSAHSGTKELTSGLRADVRVQEQSSVYKLLSLNRYGGQPNSISNGQYPFTFVLEPYRETKIYVALQSDSSAIAVDNVASVEWSVDGTLVESSAAVALSTMCTSAVTTQTITATITELDGTVETTSVEATCIYVRRALTDLASEDKEIFLDAMETVYRIEREDGIAQYGDDFMNFDDFQMLHLDGAGRVECDGWHDNAGVFPHHSAFTLLFEQNLQLIDPSIALPHWDYFLDGDDYGYDEIESIPALEEFGNFRTFDEEHPAMITEGRFANLPVRPVREGFDVKNPYGLLRSPWNVDSTPTIRRYKDMMGVMATLYDLPGCTGMATCYSESTYGSFSSCAADAFHGPVHGSIGGSSPMTDEMATKVETLRAYELSYANTAPENSLTNEQVFYFKKFWRHGFTRCPSSCNASDAESVASCTCSISQAMRDAYTFTEMIDAIGMHLVASQGGFTVASADVRESFLDVFGSSMYVGDMFTSAAPADPTFWLIHSPMERLYHVIQDEVSQGVREFDSSWGYTSASQASEDSYVCDWSNVDLTDETALPNCTIATCTGHNEDDMLTMGNFLGKGETYTNAEYLQLLNITNEERPFIFESLKSELCDLV